MPRACPTALLLLLSALPLAAGASAAPSEGNAGMGRPAPAKGPQKPAPMAPTLDALFERLKASDDPAEARGIARLIEQRLDRSGSATVDLLTDRARQAMTGRDFALAAELMDRATALDPNWAEGWNRRATVFWLLSDKGEAVSDLQRALVLEPRHFEAWSALGKIYESMDEKRQALAAFRRALALYPTMDKIREAVDRLAPDVDGRDL
ncbi:tetratricopeptide repeat protein [Methylobacterium sp. J-076]|uniref:tetratricopeptide repeat protein n=1 Tax=Methylobacterium sp. J-076 TaxID=2836655 RepID=UPI001FBBCF6D|nr:tetratricopeptide repeat protein [Methylobacterium sp. J-076]MCJ2015028.1 tetratricopeptide repeat protein [Methylobacterium sp. J-076]